MDKDQKRLNSEQDIICPKGKSFGSDFSTVMARGSTNAVSVLKYAAKKANLEQKKFVTTKGWNSSFIKTPPTDD